MILFAYPLKIWYVIVDQDVDTESQGQHSNNLTIFNTNTKIHNFFRLEEGLSLVSARTYPYQNVGEKEKKLNKDITPSKTTFFAVRAHHYSLSFRSLLCPLAQLLMMALSQQYDDVMCKHLTRRGRSMQRGVYGNLGEKKASFWRRSGWDLMCSSSSGPPAGLEALTKACASLYPDQTNPLQVTALVKYW